MKIYRRIDDEKQVDDNKQVKKKDEAYNNNQLPNNIHTGAGGETKFVARVIALPLLQEGLSNTQSMASRSRLGRALLDRTHLMIRRLTHTIHRTQETPTYQYYFQQNEYLQRTLIKVDGLACSSLDIIEARLPLLHQPGATMMETLMIKPRQQLNETWMMITQPWQTLNGSISNKLDQVELWIGAKEGRNPVCTSEGTDLHQRILLLGGSALHLGLDQARLMTTKEEYTRWIKSLLSKGDDAFPPLATFIKSHLPNWNSRTHLTTSVNPAH